MNIRNLSKLTEKERNILRAGEEGTPPAKELKKSLPIVQDHGKVVITKEFPRIKTPSRRGILYIPTKKIYIKRRSLIFKSLIYNK